MTTHSSSSHWDKLIGWFIDNRLVSFVLVLLFVGGGFVASPFNWKLGSLPNNPVPVDAIPDIGENQQIVFTKWAGRSPRDIEDQITYPLTAALLGVPGVRTVRSSSAFGFSTIYLIFEDDVDFYWSRSRVLEKLASLPLGTVPEGVSPTLGPDATGLGQIFWYSLEGQDKDGNVTDGWDPDELRSIQDWNLRYALQAVPGVSEVASVGGFVRELQVDVNPETLRAHDVTLAQVANAVRQSNLDIGARTLEINGAEYLIRSLGFVQSLADLEATVVVARENTPIRIRDVAKVSYGPALRRGALDDEGGPAVGGVVVARFGENPLAVISAVKEKLAEIQPGLPKRTLDDGTLSQITVVPFYDRTKLIEETLGTLSSALSQQLLITLLVVLIMLRNIRSSLLISLTLPLGVLLAFLFMKLTGVDANVMALGGIAIAIGTMVDIGIVFVENMNQHLDRYDEDNHEDNHEDNEQRQNVKARSDIVRAAAAEVAPAVMTSVLTTVVSFLPVLGLSSTELKLFGPLAFTKTFAMSGAFLLAIVLLPGLGLLVLRKRPRPIVDEVKGWMRLRKSTFRLEHFRDWLFVVLGLYTLKFSAAGGILVMLMGVFRLARPLLSAVWVRRITLLENVVGVVAVTILLAHEWMPLGPGHDFENLFFVAFLLATVMGTLRLFESSYVTILTWVLSHKALFLVVPSFVMVLGAMAWLGFSSVFSFWPDVMLGSTTAASLEKTFPGLGREYMPPFDEGSFLYMPTTMPHASIGEVLEMLSEMDAAIAQIPEVERVVGKLGRVESALDPAPVSMIETVINYRPEFIVDDKGNRIRQWREHIHSAKDIWKEITKAAKRPGVTGAPILMPINARIIMLQSGMRAPMGIKVHGPSLDVIEAFGMKLEKILKNVATLQEESVFADRVVGKPYLEIHLDREAIGRFGLSVVSVQEVLQIALGGITLTRTVEGRERYAVRVRYMREARDSIEALHQVFVPTSDGQQVPLKQLAQLKYVRGPQMIKSEDTFLTSYVLFEKDPDVAELEAVELASAAIQERIDGGSLVVPNGVSFTFAGSYQNQLRSEKRLLMLVPVALALIFILLYLQFRQVAVSFILFTGVAVAVSGGFLLLWCYGQSGFLDVTVFGTSMRTLFRVDTINLSVGVWIGFIALAGIATDDGVVMATYLKQVFSRSPALTVDDIRARTLEAGTRRVRACLMTTATTLLALLPVVTAQGRGADIMMPMALPALGGMLIELMTLFVVPALYCSMEEAKLRFSKSRQS
ncbi:MAG: efflux RND transporter permease subunit [Deltaproteobacteria bacterium]|nr:efflux RND transporter permease subunit [Deltaproteobacteria bacterium]